MFIKSINLKNISSFGNEGTPELKDFKTFNLFIGKNGSGKTNVFRVLSDLKIDNDTLDRDSINRNIQFHNSTQSRKTSDCVYIATNKGVYSYNNYDIFRNSVKYMKIIVDEKNENSEIRERKELLDNINKLDEAKKELLRIAFRYIFDRWVSFSESSIVEAFRKSGDILSGSPVTRSYREQNDPVFISGWSSGYSAVVNLLLEIFLNYDKNIILIDELENHLEPRILRKLLSFLFWLNLSAKQNLSQFEEIFVNNIYQKLFSQRVVNSQFIEWRKSIVPVTHKQFFISSHSPVLINEFLKYLDFCSIYEFDSQFQLMDGYEILVSVVKQVQNAFPHSILDNLGATGADLLQTNGVVWVEGPSDVIYIRKWLNMYTNENKLPEFEQGIHYEFQMFGGAILDSICYDKEEDNELHKLVSMFSFSRNAFVVIDSDAIMGVDRRVQYKSKFEPAKKFISEQFNELSKKGYKLGLWYEKDNTKIQTLEDYLDKETKRAFRKVGTPTKKKYAEKVVNYWGENGKSLAAIHHDLEEKIKVLYDKIVEWNN